MTLVEFKKWLDGFVEGIGEGRPTKEQWTRIKERLAEVDSTNQDGSAL